MGLSLGHLLLLSVVVLLFGGKKIPEVAAGLGKGMYEFRLALKGPSEPPVALAPLDIKSV